LTLNLFISLAFGFIQQTLLILSCKTLPKTEVEDSYQERPKPLFFLSLALITLPKMNQTRQCLNI
ncbi:hypothetical protein, partial [Nodularia chucula]|uniref:hypothetical protein n=1 Tax=Nodularia chucula TaxID=3093667 RepID=UPI0039C5ED3A